MHEAKSGLVAHLEAFAGNTIEFIRSESPLLIDGMGIPDIDVDVHRRHVVIVAEEPDAAEDLKALKPFIKEYQPVLVGRRRRRRRAAQGRIPARSSSSATRRIDERRGAALAAPRWCYPPTPTATRRASSASRIWASAR